MSESTGAAPAQVNFIVVVATTWAKLPVWVRAMPPLLLMVLLWLSSNRTPERAQSALWRQLLHNCGHVVAYALLGAALWFAFTRRPPTELQPWRSRIAWGAAVCYGVVDELHQSFVPGRVCSFGDLVTDAGGAALAICWLRWQMRLSVTPIASLLACVAACLAGVALATFTPW